MKTQNVMKNLCEYTAKDAKTLKQKTDLFIKNPVSYTHLTLPTTEPVCRSRWSPYH